ncbi:GDSL-like Lipase/Acylhydrolase family protein [Candidatus Anstonella stagnisolia]|nr:GDSL-like Lipase/Acylhydrolase family protein [Candidatus Anstonella stagnisolia]
MGAQAGSLGVKIRGFFKGLYRRRGIFYFLYRSIGEPTYPFLCLHSAYWLLWAHSTKKPLVHFIGDSHTTSFNFQPRFVVHHIGQATMHNLSKDESSSGSKKLLVLVLSRINRQRDKVCLVFGEIDCRIHFYYQHMKRKGEGATLESLMDETISNYSQVLSGLVQDGFSICVYGIPPAAAQENIHGYPFYGSPSERSKITREFNRLLKAFCSKNSIPFIDVYSATADGNGFLPPVYARDDVHLNSKIAPFVKGELNKTFGLDLK